MTKSSTELLGSLPIPKLLIQQAIPASIGILVMSLNILIDTIFVGQWIGSNAIAAINVVLPVSFFIAALGMSIGIGGASIISRSLGEQNSARASHTFGNQITLTLALTVLVVLFGVAFVDQIIPLFGGKGALFSYARTYYLIVMYGVPLYLAALLCLTILSFALTQFSAAYFQSRRHFIRSLVYRNSFNILLLSVALLLIAFRSNSILIVMLLLAAVQCVISVAAVVAMRSAFKSVVSDYAYNWREALAIVFMASSSGMLVQLERLVTPRVLSLEDLATLGVLLAIVGPPFRLLQITLGYVLLPLLRAAKAHAERVSLLVTQLSIVMLIIIPLWVFLWFATPFLFEAFLTDEYAMPPELILAALVAGTAKGLSGIARAGVTALSSIRGMEIMGIIGWISVLLSIAAAYWLSGYGLAGVIYGVSFGWIIRLMASTILIRRQLRHHRFDAVAMDSSHSGQN